MNTVTACTFASLFVPQEVQATQDARIQLVICKILIKNCLEAGRALSEVRLRAFDSQAYDFGCERQAVNIALDAEEARSCELPGTSLKERVFAAYCNFSGRKGPTKAEVKELFDETLSVAVPPKLGYFLQAFMLKFTKVDNGDLPFTTDYKILGRFCKLGNADDSMRRLVECTQIRFSARTAALLQERTALPLKAQGAGLNGRIRTFCINLISIKGALEVIKREGIPLLLATKQVRGPLVRFSGSGEFEQILPEEASETLIVMQGKLKSGTLQDVLTRALNKGFEEALLAQTLQAPPLPGKGIENLAPEVQEEYRALERKALDPNFELKHFFASTKKEEGL